MSKDADSQLFESVVAVILMFILMVPGLMLSGWVVATLWRWFVSSTFDVMELSWTQAMGLGLFAHYFTNRNTGSSKDPDDPWKTLGAFIGHVFVTPLLFVGIGWLLYQVTS